MKLNRLALTIVHFDAEDVIATSGGGVPAGAFPLSTRTGFNYYATLRSEAEEAGLAFNESMPSDLFAYFQYNAGTSSFEDTRTSLAMENSDHYAWYSNGHWWTENKTVESYGYDRTSTANWRTE